MIGNVLGHFQLAADLQVSGDASGTESVIANSRFDGRRFRPPTSKLEEIGVLCFPIVLSLPVQEDLSFPATYSRRKAEVTSITPALRMPTIATSTKPKSPIRLDEIQYAQRL
jgi:hypothetical protein